MNFSQQISQLSIVPIMSIRQMIREINQATLPWIEHYSEYQSSGWKSLSIMNPSGDDKQGAIYDGKAQPTELLNHLPTIELFLQDLGLDYMWVRLTKLEPSSYLWEHRDFAELNERPKMRLHIPLTTNDKCRMILNDHSIFLRPGFIWKLNPTHTHGVCNEGNTDRIHLLIDCYVDSKLESMIKSEWLETNCFELMAEIPMEDNVAISTELIRLGFFQTAERNLMKFFFKSRGHEGLSYERIINVYKKCGYVEYVKLWEKRREHYLAIGVKA